MSVVSVVLVLNRDVVSRTASPMMVPDEAGKPKQVSVYVEVPERAQALYVVSGLLAVIGSGLILLSANQVVKK